MRLRPAAVFALVVLPATTSCSKLRSGSADGGDEGGGAALGAALTILSGFEGEIDGFWKDSSKPGGQNVPVSLLIKGSKVRFEVPEQLAKSSPGNPFGDKAYVILDSPDKKLFIVSDPKKEAIVLDLNTSGQTIGALGGGPPHGPGAPPPGPATKITKTGKYDTVAGYKCENWDIASDHREGTVCVADEGASWLSIPLTGIPTERAWMLDLADGKHFPLRFVGYQKDGTTEETRVEVSKIDKKSLPDADFQVPAGYKQIDLEKMFQGLGMPGGLPMPPHPPPHH
jgi:hypothetical protein